MPLSSLHRQAHFWTACDASIHPSIRSVVQQIGTEDLPCAQNNGVVRRQGHL